MTVSTDAYWDELGVAWRAINPDLSAIAPRLKRRLRWQAACFRAILIVGTPLSVAGLILGLFTVWRGWSAGTWNFVIRGIAVVAIALLLAFASWSLRVGAGAQTGSVAEMIDLTISRAEKSRNAIRVGYYVCAVAATFGVLGYLIRTHFARPPVMSPIEPLVLLAVSSVTLFLFHLRVTDDLARFRYLKGVLLAERPQ